MDFSISAFMCPLHAVIPYTQRSCFTRLKAFTRPQDLKPFERCEATLERCVAAFEL